MKRLLLLIVISSLPLYSAYKAEAEVSVEWHKGLVVARTVDSIKNDIHFNPEKKSSINKLRMVSYQRAQKNSRELMASQLLNLRVENNRTLRSFIETSEFTREQISYALSNRLNSQQRPLDFYTTESIVQLSFIKIIETLPFVYPNNDFPSFAAHAEATRYTSLIIDTRGTEFKPLLFPAIIDEGGLEIYNRNFINIERAGSTGIVHYVYSELSARAHKAAGDYPYFTIALKTINGNPVIGFEDVRRIFSKKENTLDLKKCRVILIIEKEMRHL